MDITLDGKDSIDYPSILDIERELSNLIAGVAEFVILSKGEEFIQAAPSESKPGMLHVEARRERTYGSKVIFVRYELRSPVTLERTCELFKCFYNGELTSMVGAWRKIEEEPHVWQNLDGTVRDKIIVLLVLSFVLIVGISIVVVTSKAPWQQGLLSGLFAFT